MIWVTLNWQSRADSWTLSAKYGLLCSCHVLAIRILGCRPGAGVLRPGFPQPNRSQADVTVSSSAERPIPTPPARQERIPQAILYMVAAGAIFSFSSAASKWLVATYPVGEVLFSRVFVSLIFFSAFALPTADWPCCTPGGRPRMCCAACRSSPRRPCC